MMLHWAHNLRVISGMKIIASIKKHQSTFSTYFFISNDLLHFTTNKETL